MLLQCHVPHLVKSKEIRSEESHSDLISFPGHFGRRFRHGSRAGYSSLRDGNLANHAGRENHQVKNDDHICQTLKHKF